jgi:MarR family transcriptional regulator, lower aerobic nicotinate degradation pathway regulator
MSLPELYASPGYLARRAQQITMGLFAEEFDGWDITAVQYVILIAVNDRPGLDQRSLMRLLAIDRSTIGTTLNVIEKRRLVERVTPKTNGRVKQLFITDAGRCLLESTRACFESVQHRFLAPLGERDAAIYLRFLSRLVAANNEVSRAPLAEVIIPADLEKPAARKTNPAPKS